MEKQAYRKSLDLQKSGNQWSVDERYGDANSRKIIISLTDGGKPFYLDEDINVYVAATNGLFVDCRVESGVAIFEPTRKFLETPGTISCELRLISANSSGSQVLSSPRFEIEVYDVLADDTKIVESEDYSALAAQTVKAVEATKRANDISQTLEDKLANGEFKGDKGDTGEQGVQGDKGDKGAKGDKGDIGPQGVQGAKGDKGDIGPQGIQGAKGDKGDTGPQGVQGLKGDKGDPGTTDYTLLKNQPITILSQDFKVSDLKKNSLYFINNGISCKKEDGSVLVNLYAGTFIITGIGNEAQVFDSFDTYNIEDMSTGDWFNSDCNHITTQKVDDLLSDLSNYIFKYGSPLDSKKKNTTTISGFAESITKKTMALESNDLLSTISSNGKYSIYGRGIFRLGHPNAVAGFTPLEIKVNKGDTIYVKFSKTETECLCDIVYIGDIGKNIPDDANYEYSTIDVWSGQLGFAIGATEYDSTLWDVISGAQSTADNINRYLDNLPCAKSGGLVYSTQSQYGRPEFRAVTLGNGLKFENGVLSLDTNGDNLKYGTSTAQAEVTNENEVMI